MIATDKQYGVTQKRLAAFRAALHAAEEAKDGSPESRELYRRSLRSQIDDLQQQLALYDELRRGNLYEFEVADLASLPLALVRARIARQLSQTDLAELVGMAPQQIQRWESDGYSRAGFDKLKKIAGALRLRISPRVIFGAEPPVAVGEIRRELIKIGLPAEVFDKVIVPQGSRDDIDISEEIDERMQRLLGFGATLAAQGKGQYSPSMMRFKLPASAQQERTRAYAAYVNGLCSIVGKTIGKEASLPQGWADMRASLMPSGKIDFETILNKVWDLGVCVVALDDPIAFHGSCWRRERRTVVLLKQSILDPARWLFDLLHELYHAAVAPAEDDFVVIEADETSDERREAQEEKRANRFAALVLLNGRLVELTDEIARRANGRVERMKIVTNDVASEQGIPVGILANQMAHRLASSGYNWWGVAASLYQPEGNPLEIVRSVFRARADTSSLDRVERDIVSQAIGV